MDCIDHGLAGDKDGYGSTCKHEYRGLRNKLKMHRLSYCRYHDLHIQDIDSKVIMHSCDNPRCVNPHHLRLGSVRDNILDRVSKGRYCGASAHAAKLGVDDIKFIRENYRPRSKTWNTSTLGAKFGVAHQTISVIIRNKSYKEQVDNASI